MAIPKSQFELVEDAPPREPAGANLLFVALKALSQRTIIALSNLFCLLTVGSAFWLWHSTPDPSAYQIASLSVYAVFVLTANWIVRGRL